VHTNEGDFGQVHFYALDVARGVRTGLTSAEGRQDVERSPDGTMLAVLHSTANQPPELYLQSARAGSAPRRVTESPTAEFRSYNWIKPEIVMVTARDGAKVPARIYRQGRGVESRAVIFVHGAAIPERAQVVVELLPGVHVPPPAGVTGLHGARPRLPRQRRPRA
jgi:dipeptidyl aminopeptidase/acylaminoacyl peptidase